MKIDTKIGACAVLIASLFIASAAHADAESSRRAFYAQLHAKGFDIGRDAQTTVAKETVINGVYRVTQRGSNRFVSYITENGKLSGDSSGWRVVGSNTPLSPEDRFILMAEMVRNISPERTVKIQYGDGGGRKIILLSSLDCPFCAKMEANLARLAPSLNTTFYLVPSTLNGRDDSALPLWGDVAKIWCSQDSASAWKTFWATRRVPAAQQCAMNGVQAREASREFRDLLQSVGIKPHGSPAIIREDGRVFTPPAIMNAAQAEELYGPTGLKGVPDVFKMSNAPYMFLGRPS
jgi:hypothetical protein